jgi:diaminobutyrate-2-oxoglutarate transaminase
MTPHASPTAVFELWESEVRGYCRAYPKVFDRAVNAQQFDEDGNAYLDFFAGAGVLNFGHNHPRMKQAIVDWIQRDGVAHSLDFYTTAKRDFMQAFVDTILEPRGLVDYKLQFTGPTGTNAVEAALKLARLVTGRTTVACFTNGFHGMTLGSLEVTANPKYRCAAGRRLCGMTRLPFEGTLGPNVDTLDVIRRTVSDPSNGYEKPAAFIVETIQAEGGVNVASTEWLQGLQEIAREQDILLIVDDIQAGCGRTGRYFSFEEAGLQPDLVPLAKGIGGFGTPLAMVMVRRALDIWKPGDHTGTFRGQDISFVAGREALRLFEDDAFLGEVRQKASVQQDRLAAMVERHADKGVTLRGRGLIHGVDTHDGEAAKKIVQTAFDHGLIIGTCGPAGRVIKPLPPLTIPEDQHTRGLDILETAMDHVLGEA